MTQPTLTQHQGEYIDENIILINGRKFPQQRASQFIPIEKFDIQVYLIRVEL